MALTIVKGRIVYRCSTCGANGCKLWREYNTFLSHQSLYCVGCACTDQNSNDDAEFPIRAEEFDSDGKRPYKLRLTSGIADMGRTDQIHFLIPAVPTEDGATFWSYTSVPQPLVEWWRALPTQAVV